MLLQRGSPMSLNDGVSYSLWLGGSVALIVAAGVILRRRQSKEFPMFFCYLLFQIFQTALLFPLYLQIHQHYTRYFYAYWLGQAIAAGLRFAVIHEIFSLVLMPYQRLQKLGFILFRWGAAILILVAGLVASSGAKGDMGGHLISLILLLDRSVNVVQCGLLFFLFIFCSSFGISWRHRVFGIGMGFALVASTDLATAALLTQFGEAADWGFEVLRRGIYDVVVLIWIRYLLSPETQLDVHARLPESNLETWNQELRQLLHR
jgi:hypothetical protein